MRSRITTYNVYKYQIIAETLDDHYYSKVPLPRIVGYCKPDQLQALAAGPAWHDQLHQYARLVSRVTGLEDYNTKICRLHSRFRIAHN